MRLFVTGGTGFFGKALLRHWKDNPMAIVGVNNITFLSRNPDKFKKENKDLLSGLDITFHKGDIMESSSLPAGVAFSHIIHAATDSTFGPQLSPLSRYNQIVQGTQNILDFAIKTSATKFLLTSSGGVYGPQPPEMKNIPESYCGMPDPLNVTSAYGVGKRAAEHLVALYAELYAFDFVIARCFAFVGQDLPLNVHFAVGNFLSNALNGEDIIVNSDGKSIRSYMDQRDLAHWISELTLKRTPSRVYNVGSSEPISIEELARLICQVTGSKSNVKILGRSAPDIAVPRNRYVPDIGLSRELGLFNSYCLSDSLLHAFKELASNSRPI